MIVILGFGRSGTTWLSDMVSKSIGKLILFEPVHPLVLNNCKNYAYSTNLKSIESDEMYEFYNKLLTKSIWHPWLLRNHTPLPSDLTSNKIISDIWKHCKVAGVKETRMCFVPEWYMHNFDAKVLYIIRHPLPTIASILRRKNFWEFGWEETYNLFMEKTLNSDYGDSIRRSISKIGKVDQLYEKYTLMYSITNSIILHKSKVFDLKIVKYEDVYNNPFDELRGILRYVFNDVKIDINVHPSYLYTPSMTTLKTIHGKREDEIRLDQIGLKLFYEDTINDEMVDRIMEIVATFNIDIYDKNGLVENNNGT